MAADAGLLSIAFSLLFANVFSTCVVLTVLLVTWWYASHPKGRLPPGPRGLPIVGSAFSLGAFPAIAINKWRKEYGSDVLSCYLGSRTVVFLNDLESIKEVCLKQGDNFSGRPPQNIVSSYYGKVRPTGITFSHGQQNIEERRFTMRVLRDFGSGKSIMEQRIQDEIQVLNSHFREQQGKAFDPYQLVNCAVSNIISSIVFGRRFDYEDEVYQKLLRNNTRQAYLLGASSFAEYLPWLNYIPFLDFGCKEMAALGEEGRRELHFKQIDEHKQTFDPTDIRDIIDAYLKDMADNPRPHVSEAHLPGLIADYYGAGTETIATTLRWGMLAMLYNPNTQKKLQEEIDMNVERNRNVTLKDKANLPYCEAAMLEIMRRYTVVPWSVPHMNFKPAQLNGYEIPARTWVFPNIYEVHMDEKKWKDPEEFRPERFLDENRKIIRQEEIIPFGVGKRNCVGEALGRTESFLFFMNMLQRFTFQNPAGRELPPLAGNFGLTYVPFDFEICMTPRD